jgi:small multidrug resistance pump
MDRATPPEPGARPMIPHVYLILALAILAETAGTTALQASQQFTRLWPSVLVVIAYGISFYLLALTLKVMPVGVVYAMWSGLGIVFIACIGYVVFGQKLDLPAVIGTAMILAGIVVIQLFSRTAPH